MSNSATKIGVHNLQELHGGVTGGHFFFDIIVRKILDASYWWPTMNQEVHEYRRTCDQCQRTCNLLTQNLAKLVTTLLEMLVMLSHFPTTP